VYRIARVLEMSALSDQHYGGLIIWLPGTLASFAAMIVVLVTMRVNEERQNVKHRLLEFAAALAVLAIPAGASAAKIGVSNAWVRALPGNAAAISH
jgi:cytochrome c oxidase assembly factor CtaG